MNLINVEIETLDNIRNHTGSTWKNGYTVNVLLDTKTKTIKCFNLVTDGMVTTMGIDDAKETVLKRVVGGFILTKDGEIMLFVYRDETGVLKYHQVWSIYNYLSRENFVKFVDMMKENNLSLEDALAFVML